MKHWYVAVASLMLCACIGAELFFVPEFVGAFALSGKEKPIYRVDTKEQKVAISFDAAWGADETEHILEILDSQKVGATFFLTGFWVEKYPDLVCRIASRGYELGNHSQNHPDLTKTSETVMREEIESVNLQIEKLTGKKPVLFRPPFGAYNDTLITLLRQMGMHGIQWSVDSLDWKEYGRQEEIDRVLKKAEPGAIILFHNNAKYTPSALPAILDGLAQKGYTVVSVGELIHPSPYRVDLQGIQHPANDVAT